MGEGERKEGQAMASEAQCLTALDRYEEELSRRKNVVGLGVVPLSDDGPARNGMAVGVYVKKKLPSDHLADRDIVPPTLDVREGNRLIHVPTRVIELGKVEKEGAAPEGVDESPP
jgi:hypothetical protein